MRCCDCEFRNKCDDTQKVLTDFVKCYRREEFLKKENGKKQATNADRIRAMSDEELVLFLDDLTCLCVDCNEHDGKNENCPIYKRGFGRYCAPRDIMEWLQHPAKED